MMQWIAEKIVAALDRQGVLRHSSKEVYVYGFDIAIYTFVSTLGLFFIGWIGRKPWETILLIALYYTNQSAGGGFHASSHLNCFLSMAAGVVVFLLTFHFPCLYPVYIGVAALSALLLWHFPLVLHPNKKYLAKKAPQLVQHSRGILLADVLFFLITVLLRFPSSIFQTFAVALAFGAASRCVACYQHKDLVFR